MENDEIKNIAPKLNSIKKDNPFKVPDDYFENFPLIMQEKIETPEKQSFFYKLFAIVKPQFKLALGFVALMLIAYITIKFTAESMNVKENISEVVIDDEIELFENIDNEEIISVLLEDSIITETLDETDIIEYLVDDNIDYLAYLDEF